LSLLFAAAFGIVVVMINMRDSSYLFTLVIALLMLRWQFYIRRLLTKLSCVACAKLRKDLARRSLPFFFFDLAFEAEEKKE
jgi:hypothetical protein